jgi:hypothetical protein
MFSSVLFSSTSGLPHSTPPAVSTAPVGLPQRFGKTPPSADATPSSSGTGTAPLPKVDQLLSSIKRWHDGNGLALQKQDEAALKADLGAVLAANRDEVKHTVEDKLKAYKNHPHFEALVHDVTAQVSGRNKKVGGAIQAMMALEYVPSTAMKLATMYTMYNQMEQKGLISAREKELLMEQQLISDGIGFAIHASQVLLSFQSVNWLAAGLTHHPTLRRWSRSLNTQAQQALQSAKGTHDPHKISAFDQLKVSTLKQTAKRLETGANLMQRAWNKMQLGQNKTFTGIFILMLSNVVTYGLLRPLVMNGTFCLALHDQEKVPLNNPFVISEADKQVAQQRQAMMASKTR